jgi:Ni,Fe-hydrogenase I large subunit
LRTFIDNAYIPDVIAVAGQFPEYFELGKGCGNFLAYGVFPQDTSEESLFFPSGVVMADTGATSCDVSKITEDVASSLFSSPSGLHPSQGRTVPDPEKANAYSWIKAPRYNGMSCEVGPLARLLVAHAQGHDQTVKAIDDLLAALGLQASALNSVLGRHAARAIECKIIADRATEWIEQLIPGEPGFEDFSIPDAAEGVGLTEAPRGALGHWIEIKNHKISNYQCVVPTTWNASPRDDKGVPGPIEQALVGTPVADADHPIEAARIVRSFDPCLACAVH